MAKTWTGRGGFRSYGKTALSTGVSLSGVNEYLAKIEAAGKNVDEACCKAIDAAMPIIEKPMKDGANKHYRTGEVTRAIETQKAQTQGNYNFGKVGIDFDKHPEAMHGVFQEYGDGHSPGFPDPFVRPAFDENKKEVRKIQRQVLKKEGVPID